MSAGIGGMSGWFGFGKKHQRIKSDKGYDVLGVLTGAETTTLAVSPFGCYGK